MDDTTEARERIVAEMGEKHPHLGPAMADESVSREAFTDHALAVKSRDREEISRWQAFAARIFGPEPLDTTKKVTDLHFWDVFGKRDPNKTLSQNLKDSFQYGQEKARQAERAVIWLLTRGQDRRARYDSIDRFEWGNGTNADPMREPLRGEIHRVPDPKMTPVHPAIEGEAHLRIAQTKAIGQTRALPAPPKALPAPPKALPAPPRRLPPPRGGDAR